MTDASPATPVVAAAAASPSRPHFEIVLVEPEIPNNTGNIGRTAAATGCRLHVVHPLGFSMDEKARRRAGLDYWHLVDCREHADWQAADEAVPGPGWLLTAGGGRPHWDVPFELGDRLIFGKESAGVGPAFQSAFEDRHGADRVVSLPMAMVPGVRSLNLATAVAIVVYEGLRRLRTQGRLDPRIGVRPGSEGGPEGIG